MCEAAFVANTARINYKRASESIQNAANKLIGGKFYRVFVQGVDFEDKLIEFTVECTRDKLIIPLDSSVKLEGVSSIYCSSNGICVIDLYAVLRYEGDNAAKAAVFSMLISDEVVGGTLVMLNDKGHFAVRQFFGEAISEYRHYIKEHYDFNSADGRKFAPLVPGPWQAGHSDGMV